MSNFARAMLGGAVLALCALIRPVAAGELTIAALSVRIPKEETASFAGFPRGDRVAGQPGSLLYPGPLPVALVGVAAHGMIESFKQSRERKANGALPDLALEPYRRSLERLTNAELLRRALEGLETHGDKSLIGFTERAGAGWLIECSPQFLMTDDARALVLRNAVVVHSPNPDSAPTFKNVVEVVGQPRESVADDSDNSWMIHDGELLTAVSAALLRESITLALELNGDPVTGAAAYRTVHYPRGGADATERALLLRETPDRLLLKNLHGWVMSVPAR